MKPQHFVNFSENIKDDLIFMIFDQTEGKLISKINNSLAYKILHHNPISFIRNKINRLNRKLKA